jgi:Hsp20/alpha crystallin family
MKVLVILFFLFWLRISTIAVMPGECFEIKLDVQRCKREDITVEFVDNCLVIQTRKCQPGDNSIVARKFSKRMYPIELSKYDKDSLQYEFDDKGMLNVQIHPKKVEETTTV